MSAQTIRELLNAERERRRKAIGFLRGKYKFDQARAEDHMNAGSGIRTRCPACEGRETAAGRAPCAVCGGLGDILKESTDAILEVLAVALEGRPARSGDEPRA